MLFFFRFFLWDGRLLLIVGGGKEGIVGVLDSGGLRQVPGLDGGGGEVWVGGIGGGLVRSDCGREGFIVGDGWLRQIAGLEGCGGGV